MRLRLKFTLLFSVALAFSLSAHNCGNQEYALLKHIIKSEQILRLSKNATPTALLCGYFPQDSISMYEHFTKKVIGRAPDVLSSGIDSVGFQAFMEENIKFVWNKDCINKSVSLVNPKGLFINRGTSYSSVSKPIFTKDGKYAIVNINNNRGNSTGGYRYTNIYKSNDKGDWVFYAHGGCKSYYH